MCTTITIEDVDFIEGELSFDDKISVLFLLYGQRHPSYLLQTLAIARHTPEAETHFLVDWINYVKSGWQSELLEALVIVQANLCLVKCGFDDDELKARFLPNVVELASFVHPILKGLYVLCEKLDDSVAVKLVGYLKENHSLNIEECNHFEMVLLNLIGQGLIKLGTNSPGSECDLLILGAAFKTLDLYELADFCKSIASSFNKDVASKKVQSDNAKGSQNFEQVDKEQSANSSQIDKYYITNQNAGIVLIINQFKFYRETNPELAQLLPLKALKDRRGTEVDKLAILNLFTGFGYQPIVVENIPHLAILKQVGDAVNLVKPSHCSLVVCLLSHGQEGKVYGSNSIPVSVKAVENAMASDKLTGKPKLLFVQACQGSDLQSAVDIPGLEHDGPSSEKTASVFVDFLVACSTVPGFASVRHIEKGSWFIQELCQKLKQLHKRRYTPKRWWIHELWKRRELNSQFLTLRTSANDDEMFSNFFRLTRNEYDQPLNMVKNRLSKSQFRALSADFKLALTLSDHIMNILTAVINDVSSKRGYGNECMVPIIYSTLRKKLCFEAVTTK